MHTAYQLQLNRQTERFNCTVLSALRKFCAEHQNDLDSLTSALAFRYNCHVHTRTGLKPYHLVLSRTLPALGIEIQPQGCNRTPKEARRRSLNELSQRIIASKTVYAQAKHE